MKDQIKKAYDSAEKEIEEKEIANLKSIIKDLLEKKVSKEKEKREVEKEISVIKQTIDDFKSGRLDKIKELQEKDGVAKSLLPFKIIILNQPIITQPWGWHYQVVPRYNPLVISNGNGWGGNTITTTATLTGATNAVYNLNSQVAQSGLTGNAYAAFTGGSYNVSNGGGSGIINL